MITAVDMEKFSGKWVLIFEDKIVNHSVNLEDMLKKAEEFDIEKVTIAKAPPYNPKLNPKLL